MYGAIEDPTEQPTRVALSPAAASSIASQQACAMSVMVKPASALGERPYPGMSIAMQRYQVDRCAI